jgi:hypothetical protein
MMVGMLGAWRVGPALARAALGNINDTSRIERYEQEQRAASVAVQASNELIFRNMCSRTLARRGTHHDAARYWPGGPDRAPSHSN